MAQQKSEYFIDQFVFFTEKQQKLKLKNLILNLVNQKNIHKMPYEKSPIPPGILRSVEKYRFKIFRTGGNHPDNFKKLTKESEFQELVDEISDMVFQFIKREQDEYIFNLIRAKAKGANRRLLNIEEYGNQNKPIELVSAKTLMSSLRSGEASEPVIKVLEAFVKVAKAEEEGKEHLKRVAGAYNLYNLHHTIKGKFQVSNLILDPYGESKLYYFSRRNEADEGRVIQTPVGSDKLLISFTRDNCKLMFYAYIGAGNNPELLQPVFFYNNGKGYTIASLAVLEKVPESELLPPARELDSIPKQNIARFLKQKASLLTAHSPYGNDMRFKIEDLEVVPGPYKQDAKFYEQSKTFTGLFHIYFNEQYPSLPEYIRNDFYSTVGKGILWIYEDENGVLSCMMKTRGNTKGRELIHKGLVLNETLNNSDYLILSLFLEKDKDRYLNLILFKAGEDLLFGSHNIMYSPAGKLGSGAIVLKRIENTDDKTLTEEDFNAAKPAAIYPCPKLNSREDWIINYLASKNRALVTPITEFDKLKEHQNQAHEGLYKMYSYGKGGIRIGILRIHKSGFAEHISIGGTKEEKVYAYGKADLLRQILSLTLKNKDNSRTGFCVFKTESDVPPVKGKTIYLGTFCGVTRRNGEFPLASKLILEFISRDGKADSLEPKWITFGDPEYQTIHSAFRDALMGPLDAMIGFFKDKSTILTLEGLEKFNSREFDKGEAFIKAAAYSAAFDQEDVSAQLIKKAVKYGRLDAEAACQPLKDEQANICLERAAYQLAVKEDLMQCVLHLQRAVQLAPSAISLSEFEKEVADCKRYGELVKDRSFQRLKKDNGLVAPAKQAED